MKLSEYKECKMKDPAFAKAYEETVEELSGLLNGTQQRASDASLEESDIDDAIKTGHSTYACGC